MVNHKHYTYRLTWSEDDQEFVALCAEFPSVSFLSESHNKALTGIVKLVGDIIEDMKANGEIPPSPFADRKYSGKFQLRVPPDVHRNLAIQAAEQGVNLNRYVSSKLG